MTIIINMFLSFTVTRPMVHLMAVDNVVFLNWTEPLESSLTYCVAVENITSSSKISRVCEINGTQFNYFIPPDIDCNIYKFIVTPVTEEEEKGPAGTVNYRSDVKRMYNNYYKPARSLQ